MSTVFFCTFCTMFSFWVSDSLEPSQSVSDLTTWKDKGSAADTITNGVICCAVEKQLKWSL